MAINKEIKQYIDNLFKDLKVQNSIANGTRMQGSEIGEKSLISGINNASNAPYSAAIGSNNEVKLGCDSAVVFGEGNVAYSKYQLVHGMYNKLDANNNYAHIVGGGTYIEPKNIYTLDWEGNATFAGNIMTSSSPTTDNSLINLNYFNSNIPIKFYPFTELSDDTIRICVNDLDPYTIYKVKLNEGYSYVKFVVRANNRDYIFLSSDASINKYNMFVSSKTEEEMILIINSALYRINLVTGRVIREYDETFTGPDGGGGGITGSGAEINDDIIDVNYTWSSEKINSEIDRLSNLLQSAFTSAEIDPLDNSLVFYSNNSEVDRVSLPNTLDITEADIQRWNRLETQKLSVPANAGTDGQILSIDSNGNAVWIDNTGGTGGAASDIPYESSDPNISSVQDALDKLLYVRPTVSINASPSFGTYEIGSTIYAPITLSWSTNKEVVSQTLNNGIGTIAPGTNITTYNNNITNNTTFTVTVTDAEGTSASSSRSYNFSLRRYWGAAIEPSVYNSNFILGLSNNEFASSRAKGEFTVNASTGQYIYYCFPTSWGTPIFNVGGFEGGFQLVTTLSFTNASGYTSSYVIWRSDHISLGSQKIIVK